MHIRESENFIPANQIPILSPEDTISDAVDAMRKKRTRLVVVTNGTDRWGLWLDEIAGYCTEKGPVTPWIVQLREIIEGVPPSESFDMTMEPDKPAQLLDKERVVMVTEGGSLAGVATSDSQALWPPAVSECVQGHLFFPPIPKRCPYDGTTVE